MPLLTACYLALALVVILLLTDRWRLQPFLALAVITAAFGFAIHMSLSQIGNLFGIGFSVTMQTLGLVVLAGSLMSVLAEQSGAADRLAAHLPRRPVVAGLVTFFGTLAGLASTPAAALAVLMPLLRSVGRNRADGGNRLVIFLGLALSAGHGLLLPAPVMVAAMAILGAKPLLTAIIGLPIALLTAGFGVLVSASLLRRLAIGNLSLGSFASGHTWPVSTLPAGAAANRVSAALIPVSLLLVVLLVIQSLADIPSEPFGGGPAREMLLGLGRPLVLLLIGPGLLLIALNRWSRDVISAEGWLGRGIIQAAPALLLVGAAGGFQRLLQETGMAELLGEQLLSWHLGLLLPFLVAALIKILQGNSLVAAITTAGMIQPLLVNLGLDHDTGRALAALAIGIGSVTAAHVNDAFFWLIGDNARLRPSHTVIVVTLSMLAQAVLAIVILELIAAVSVAIS